MSGLELIAVIGGGFSVISTVVSCVYNVYKQKKQNKKHRLLMEAIEDMKNTLTPVDIELATPQDTNPYEVVDEEQYKEMKPYYNVKTGKTEYFIEAPYTERNHRIVPKLNI
jgi:hypothetical protein